MEREESEGADGEKRVRGQMERGESEGQMER